MKDTKGRYPTRSRHSASVIVRTPSSVAFRAFDPASAPTTTMSVFFDTESVTFAPSASARAFASGRVMVSRVPVNTTVLPAIGLSASSRASGVLDGQFGGEFVQRPQRSGASPKKSVEFLGDRGTDAADAAQFQPLIRPDLVVAASICARQLAKLP